jgi:hypothetical protein
MADMAVERLQDVRKNYAELAAVVGPHLPEPQRGQIAAAADEAGAALEAYREWLKTNRPRFNAPYAIGRKAFEWFVQRVLMMPYDSEQLLSQAQIERDRGWAFLALEQQKNRALPQIAPAKDNHEYSEWKDATDVLSRLWAEDLDLFTRPSYVGEMRDEEGGVWIEPFGMMAFPKQPKPAGTKTEFLVPPDHWFSKIYWEKGHRLDPGTNHAHSDYPGHTFEGAVSRRTTKSGAATTRGATRGPITWKRSSSRRITRSCGVRGSGNGCTASTSCAPSACTPRSSSPTDRSSRTRWPST